jgi:hypothetical protein
MFNIVKRGDFMLANDIACWREVEHLRLEKYGHDYVVVSRSDTEPVKELKAPAARAPTRS